MRWERVMEDGGWGFRTRMKKSAEQQMQMREQKWYYNCIIRVRIKRKRLAEVTMAERKAGL